MTGSFGPVVDLNAMSRLLVACLGGPKSCLPHVTMLFDAVDSYYNPVNSGEWTGDLADFLKYLVKSFCLRLHRYAEINLLPVLRSWTVDMMRMINFP